MANEWSQELLNEINSAGQAFEEAALSGNPRIPNSVRQQVAENVLYRYYQQQKAAREANQGRTAHSYLRDTVSENVANPVEYSTEQLQAAKARTQELSEKLDNLKATKSRALTASPYAAAAYQNIASDEEIRNTESALALAQKQQERMERDTARAKQAAQVRAVDEALERGVGYAAQYDAYSQSLKALNAEKQKLTQQLNDIRGGRAGYFGQENAEAQEKAEKDTTDRIERLEREIERIEGQRNYASLNLGKDKNAAVIIKQGEELSKNLKEVWDNNDEVMASVMGERRVARFRDKADRYHPTENWTPEQQAVYNYLLAAPNHGAEDARDYAAQINDAINRGLNTAATAQDYAWGAQADGNFLQKAGATAALLPAGIAAAPSHALSWMEKISDVMQGNPYVKNAVPTLADKIGAATKGRAEQLNKDGGTVSESVPIVGGKGFGDLFQLGQSVVQSAVMGNLVGEGATLAAFFAQSADSAFDEAKARGGSDEYAAMFSTLSGLAEVLGEKISLDHMLKGGNIGSLKYILKQAGIEGAEEVNTSVLNQFFDRITANVTGDQTAIQDKISALVRQGMSYEEAEKQVWKETVEDVAWDFVGGFVSGGMSGAVQSGVRGTQNKLWEMRKDSVLGKQNAEGQREGGKKNTSNDELSKMFDRALKRGDIRGAEQILQVIEHRGATAEEQEYGPADPTANERMRKRLERQLNGESLNPETENADIVTESATNRRLAEEARIQEQFPTLHPITMRNIEHLSVKDLVTVARTMTTPELVEAERYARSIGEDAKADALHEVWKNPDYRYQEPGNEEKPFSGDEEDPMRYAPKNAAGQQEIPAGQITQPSQQNTAQTVKLGNFEQKKSDSRPKLQEGHYYYLKDKVGGLSEEGLAAVKKAYSEEFERLKNGEKKFSIEAPDGSVHTILVGSAGYGNSGASWYIDPDGYRGDAPYLSRTYQGYRYGHEESKEEALAHAIEIVRFDIESDKHSGILDYTFSLPSSSLTASTESGTMSVPNTQEVTTNAGEQAVQQSEEAGTEAADLGVGRRPAGAGAATGQLGASENASEAVGRRESGNVQSLPRFVTQEDLNELSDVEESAPISDEQKAEYSKFDNLLNSGTQVVNKPKIGSRLHLAWSLAKKLGLKSLFARNFNGSVFKDGSTAYQNGGNAIIDADSTQMELATAVAHEAGHGHYFAKFGAFTNILNGAYTKRLNFFTGVFNDAFGMMKGLQTMRAAEKYIREDRGYQAKYDRSHARYLREVNAKITNPLAQNAAKLVAEMEKARAVEEFMNQVLAWDELFIKDFSQETGLSYDDVASLRKALVASLESNDIFTAEEIAAIDDSIDALKDGGFTDDLSDEEEFGGFEAVDTDADAADFKDLRRSLNTLLRGDAEAIGRLSVDDLNFAINYTLKKANPDLDFKEKRRTYNAIANVLSGMNIDTFGYDRNVARNESNDKNNAGFDGMMAKAPNKLFYAISSRVQSDDYEGGRRGMDTIGNLQPGQYRPTGSTGSMQTVLRNALNELDRRGLNIWGKENSDRFEYDEETDDTGKQYERSDSDSDYSSQYNSATYGDSKAEDDYSDEYNEGSESRESKLRAKDQRAAEKREATSALRRLREGDNWLEGAVKVSPEAKEWGRGAKETAGQKTQGWYNINRRSSLAEREFARQRVMNARAAEDLSYEIQTMEDQADDIREEVELARRNSPAAKESLKMINSFLEELNDDIDDLHAIDDMFRDAVREDPNSDMTKQLATEGTRLSSEIENLRRDIDTLGRLANESIANNNSEELRDAEKRLRKQEQKIKAKREHLKKLLDESHGGDKSGALVASRAETAFDSMPDDVIKQIIRNGYVSMDMLQDYYGNADAAYQTMYEFQERVGETGKTRVPSVHKLTGLEKTALHGILADRKKAGKITSGYGGIEQNDNLPEAFGRQSEPDVVDDNYDIESARDIARRAEAGEFDINGSKSTKHKPSTPQAATSASIRERNRLAYQESMRTGVELEVNEPTPESMDRLNRMFAERLGIENTDNTAVSVVDNEFNAADFGEPARGMGTGYVGMQRNRSKDGGIEFRTMYDDALPTRPATDKPQKPLAAPSVAYGSVSQAARSILNSKNSFFDFSKDRPKDIPSKVTNTMGQLYSHVREMMEGDHPVNALMQLSNMVHEFENDDDLRVFSSDSIKKAVDELNDIYYNQDITNEEKAQRMVENATRTLTLISKRIQLVDRGYNMLKTFTGPKKKRDNTTFWNKYKAMQLNPSTLFKAMDGFARDKNGSGYQIAKMIENGTALYTITQTQALKRLSEISGLEGFKEFAEGNATPFDIDGVKITEQQAVEFIMQVRNLQSTSVTGKDGPTNRLNTIDGFSIMDKNGKSTFIERSEDADGTNAEWFLNLAEAMENSLSPAAKKYLETATDILDDLGRQTSDMRTNLIGTGFEGSINGTYYPITYGNKNAKSNSQQSNPAGLFSGPSYQSRTRNVGGYVNIKNVSDTMDRYIHWASNTIGYGEVAELLHVMNSTGGRMQNLSTLANEMLGQGYSEYISKFVDDVNEVPDGQKNNNSALAVLRRNMASGALLGNLGVAAKQAASLWSGVGVLSPQALLSAETYFGGHTGAGNVLLQSRSTGTSLDPTISEILHNDSFMGKLMKRSGVTEFMGKATALVDYQTVKRLFAATVVDTKLSFPGMDQNSELFAKTVEAKFQDVVIQTQPIFVKNARSGYLRSNDELMKAFAMFRTQPAQNLNAIVTAVGEYNAMKGTEFGKAAGKKLRNTIIGQTASAITFATLSAIVGFARHGLKKYRDDDDEISWAEVAKRIGLDTVESLAGISVFGGDLAKAIITMATGGEEKEFYDINAGVLSMLADTVTSVTTFGTNLVKAIREDEPLAVFNAGRQAADNILQVAAGIPANTVYRLLNAATMYTADAMYALSDGKLGNRANYDDAMKMLDSYIKGNLTEEGARKQADKAFRKNQPENLLYNLGILSSLSKSDDKTKDKGRVWLDSKLKKSGDSEEGASSNQRILDYLVKQALSAEQLDKAVGSYVTAGGYDQTYSAVRATGASPKEAIDTIAAVDADGSGSTSQNELWEYYKANQKKDKQVGAIWDSKGYTKDGQPRSWDSYKDEQERKEFKAVVDANGNNRLTQAELLAYYKAHPDEENKIAELWESNGWKTSWSSYKAKNAS